MANRVVLSDVPCRVEGPVTPPASRTTGDADGASPSLMKAMGLRTISGDLLVINGDLLVINGDLLVINGVLDLFVNQIQDSCYHEGYAFSFFYVFDMAQAQQEAESQCRRCASVRNDNMGFKKGPQCPEFTVHQFPSVTRGTQGHGGALCADDFSQLRLPGLPGALSSTPCKTTAPQGRSSPRLKELRERAKAAAPLAPVMAPKVKVEVPQSLGPAVLALSGVELQAQLSGI